MSNLTTAQKRIIIKYVCNKYMYNQDRYNHPHDVHITPEGAVSVIVNKMPNTNQRGRIFVGWDFDLLNEANNEN